MTFMHYRCKLSKLHGDTTNQSHLARIEAQRRADAFEAALRQASATSPDSNLPEPSVNITMTPDMFEHGLATLTNTEPTSLDPRKYRNIRCETFGGTQLDPADAVAAGKRGCRTGNHSAKNITGSKNTATEPGATPTANGTSNAPTAPTSKPPPRRRPA
jgi:hypothetical protein